MIGKFIYNLLLALDQLLNTLLLGHPDETLSSRLGRSKKNERYFWVSPLRRLIDAFFFWDYKILEDGTKLNHCDISVMPLEQQNFREMADYELWSWNKE